MTLSIGVPVGGVLLAYIAPERLRSAVSLGSLAIGPSAGHFYAHQWWRGAGFVCMRTALGFYALARGLGDRDQPTDDLTKILMASTLFVTIADIASAPNSVHKYNRAYSSRITPQLNLKKRHINLSLTCRI
jgi:hypothetical protein